jgi:tRNA(Phe) wybutosine-synthesizing methylase Tyw3
MKYTKKIRLTQLAINGLRVELAKSEESNINLRKALSILWDEENKRKEINALLKKLVSGRAVTKALQDRLHLLKQTMKQANRGLDQSLRSL